LTEIRTVVRTAPGSLDCTQFPH